MTNTALAEIILDATPDEVLNNIVPMMWASRIRIKKQTIEENPRRITIVGQHAISFRSWGEVIRIVITENGKGSRVQAKSASKLSSTIFDWGINKENLEILLNQLIVKSKGASPLSIREKTL